MSVNGKASRCVNASKEQVWAVLDDFPGIASWSAGIKNSYTTGDQSRVTGLGAERRCELGGRKLLDERISDYNQGESMTIDVWNVEGLPLKSSQATFSVHATGPNTSEVRIDAQAVPKLPGVIVSLVRPVLSRAVSKNFAGLLDELAAEAVEGKND